MLLIEHAGGTFSVNLPEMMVTKHTGSTCSVSAKSLLSGVRACICVLYHSSKERVKVEVRERIEEIYIRPNHESHATQFVPFTHET